MPITTTVVGRLGPSTAANTISRAMIGNAMSVSMMRERIVSVQPARKSSQRTHDHTDRHRNHRGADTGDQRDARSVDDRD